MGFFLQKEALAGVPVPRNNAAMARGMKPK
jgi:hypothetical protein